MAIWQAGMEVVSVSTQVTVRLPSEKEALDAQRSTPSHQTLLHSAHPFWEPVDKTSAMPRQREEGWLAKQQIVNRNNTTAKMLDRVREKKQ